MSVDVSNRRLPKVARPSRVELTNDLSRNDFQSDISYEKSTVYVNGMAQAVCVTDRSGMHVVLRSGVEQKVSTTTDLEAVITYRFRKKSFIDPDGILDENYVASNKGLELAVHGIKESINNSRRGRYEVKTSVKYILTREQFRSNGDDIYLHELDNTFTIYGVHKHIPVHPATIEADILRQNAVNDEWRLNIKVNDPELKFGIRFVNIFGEIFKVPVARDSLMEEGVYFTGNATSENEQKGIKNRERRLTFEEANSLGVFYFNESEAVAKGSLDATIRAEEARLKREEVEWKRETEEYKRTIAKQQQEAEKRNLEHKQEIEELLRQKERRKLIHDETSSEMELRRLREKEIMENEAAMRQHILNQDKYRNERAKSESNALLDVLKWIPLAVTGVIAVIAFFTKLLPSK